MASRGRESVAALVSPLPTQHFIFYQEATQYWVKATVGLPFYAKNGQVGAPAHGRYLYFDRPEDALAVCSLLNSSLFYVYFITYGDCFHLSNTLTSTFPIPFGFSQDSALVELSKGLMDDLRASAERTCIRTKDSDEIEYDEYYGRKCKPLIDEIDRALAQCYGFTAEEIDSVINYDAKYRMDQEGEEEITGNVGAATD